MGKEARLSPYLMQPAIPVGQVVTTAAEARADTLGLGETLVRRAWAAEAAAAVMTELAEAWRCTAWG